MQDIVAELELQKDALPTKAKDVNKRMLIKYIVVNPTIPNMAIMKHLKFNQQRLTIVYFTVLKHICKTELFINHTISYRLIVTHYGKPNHTLATHSVATATPSAPRRRRTRYNDRFTNVQIFTLFKNGSTDYKNTSLNFSSFKKRGLSFANF